MSLVTGKPVFVMVSDKVGLEHACLAQRPFLNIKTRGMIHVLSRHCSTKSVHSAGVKPLLVASATPDSVPIVSDCSCGRAVVAHLKLVVFL